MFFLQKLIASLIGCHYTFPIRRIGVGSCLEASYYIPYIQVSERVSGGEYLTLVCYIFKAATPGGIPQTLNNHHYFTILHIGLHQLKLNPFPYNLHKLSSNPLVAYAPKDIMISWINCIQQRIANLEAWIALAKFQSSRISTTSIWDFSPDAPPHTQYILHPNLRIEEQSKPSLFTFQDICGPLNGSLGNISTEDLN